MKNFESILAFLSFIITLLIMLFPVAIVIKIAYALFNNNYNAVFLLSLSLTIILATIYFIGKGD